MNFEDVKKIKCDRCGVVVGLHIHSKGYRCPLCIWNELENLIEWAKILLSAPDYQSILDKHKQTVVVSRKNMDALAEVIKEVTS